MPQSTVDECVGPSSAPANIADAFGQVAAVLKEQDQIRDNIRTVRDKADESVRRTTAALVTLHFLEGDLIAPAEAIVAQLPVVGGAIAAVEAACPDKPGAFYQYRDIWRECLQRAAFISVFVHFVCTDKLATPERVVQMLSEPSNQSKHMQVVRLPLEDYLWGVCHAVSECPRLAMNRATLRDYATAKRSAIFCSQVFEAFKQLNFRNDFLRKKYDGMKYDVKRMEEIVYDLSIRGLLVSADDVLEKQEHVLAKDGIDA